MAMRDDNEGPRRPIMLTRKEAQEAMKAIDKAREREVAMIGIIMRKRSWRPSEKAMAQVDPLQRLDALKRLQQALGEAFDLGGW